MTEIESSEVDLNIGKKDLRHSAQRLLGHQNLLNLEELAVNLRHLPILRDLLGGTSALREEAADMMTATVVITVRRGVRERLGGSSRSIRGRGRKGSGHGSISVGGLCWTFFGEEGGFQCSVVSVKCGQGLCDLLAWLADRLLLANRCSCE